MKVRVYTPTANNRVGSDVSKGMHEPPGINIALTRPSPGRRRIRLNRLPASILAFIEKRFSLQPLSHRDATAAPLLNAFDFKLAG